MGREFYNGIIKFMADQEIDKPIEQQEFFVELIEELKAIETETRYNSVIENIRGKYLAGRAIIEVRGEFNRFGYGEKMVSLIAKAWGKSESFVYQIIKFAEMFSTFEEAERNLPDGKATSWYKITQKLLSAGKEKARIRVKKYTIKEIKEMLLNCVNKEVFAESNFNIYKVVEDPVQAVEILLTFIKKLDEEEARAEEESVGTL